jgi:exopolyphosphatase/guanosine-5'-triphosphate,3'-diphosphate pyrophosphatase
MSRYAAIDVGSNSIRLLVAEVDPRGRATPLVADRQVVRLGTGVFRNGRLCESATDLACTVLQRMAGQYRDRRVDAVRAVGTSALRDALNQAEFVGRASTILDTPLEVISGLEEARLVQLGVRSRWPHTSERSLIVDVGGGSVQLSLSENGRVAGSASLPLGAVRLTEAFLESDPPSPLEIARLVEHVRALIAGPLEPFRLANVHRLIATSSTAAAVVCAANGVKRSRRHEADGLAASTAQVRTLFERVATRDTGGRAGIGGVGPRRAEIIVAGVAVLREILEGMGLPRLYYSSAGVRDGIIADLTAQRAVQTAGLHPAAPDSFLTSELVR